MLHYLQTQHQRKLPILASEVVICGTDLKFEGGIAKSRLSKTFLRRINTSDIPAALRQHLGHAAVATAQLKQPLVGCGEIQTVQAL
jgi:hypothetical protein